MVLASYPDSRTWDAGTQPQRDEKNEEPQVYEVEVILAWTLQGAGNWWLYHSVWLDFTVANNNKGWFPSPCSSWDIWGFRNRLTGHPLCRTLLLVIAEGEESTAKHKLAFKASAWKHITFAQSNFHDQARQWHSLGEGSKYLWKLTQFIIVFLSHHKYLVQSPFSSQNTLSPLPVPPASL